MSSPTLPPASVRPMEQLRMLRQVSVLLGVGGGWTSGTMARDRFDIPVHPLDPSATRWCLLGAIARVAWRDGDEQHREDRFEALVQLLVSVEPSLYTRTFPRYSDEEGKEQVLRIVRRGIDILERRTEHFR